MTYRMLVACGLSLASVSVAAQTPAPQAPMSHSAIPTTVRPVTPAERARGLVLYEATGPVREDGQPVPTDSVQVAVQYRADRWVASLRQAPVTGLQLDPMGLLAIAAGQDAVAKQQIAARLATPGLSFADQAYTLLLAVRAFGAKADDAARMQAAIGYLRQLDALPGTFAESKSRGHIALANAYYDVGDGEQVIAHMTRAFSLIPTIPFERREWWTEFKMSFLILADVWSGKPAGRAQVDSLVAWLRPYTQAAPALIAKDSAYYWKGRQAARSLDEIASMLSLLGSAAPPITAHRWINAPPGTPSSTVPEATTKTLDDGVIRVLEFGHYGCPGCLAALPKMEEIRKAAPSGVEVWFVSQEGDVWGAKHCTREEMTQHLTEFYVQRKKYGLPIALWMGPRVPHVDGGSEIQESPMSEAFKFFGWPTFVVTDGKGRVRHIQFGLELGPLQRSLQYLMAEAGKTPAASMPAPKPAPTPAPAPAPTASQTSASVPHAILF